MVKKGALSHLVAGTKEDLSPLVPDDERETAEQMVDTSLFPLLIGREQKDAVGNSLRLCDMELRCQLFSIVEPYIGSQD